MSFFEELEALVKKERKRLDLEKLRAIEVAEPDSEPVSKWSEPPLKPCPVCGKQPVFERDWYVCMAHLGGEKSSSRIGGAEAWNKAAAAVEERHRSELSRLREERDAARQALRLDPREGLVNTCRELVEILGCPENRHLTEWARRIVEERSSAVAQLFSVDEVIERCAGEDRVELLKKHRAAADGSGCNDAAWRRSIKLKLDAERLRNERDAKASEALRYQNRCKVLEQRLAAIRATAEGKNDA